MTSTAVAPQQSTLPAAALNLVDREVTSHTLSGWLPVVFTVAWLAVFLVLPLAIMAIDIINGPPCALGAYECGQLALGGRETMGRP